MTPELRRAVAAIALGLAGPGRATDVYDYDAGAYFQFDGEATSTRVNVFDYGRGCYLDGSPPSLYDYGNGNYFDFKLNGHRLSGYDYSSGTYFEAAVRSNSLSLYDYETGAYYDYSR